jgi:hypothetical protein
MKIEVHSANALCLCHMVVVPEKTKSRNEKEDRSA